MIIKKFLIVIGAILIGFISVMIPFSSVFGIQWIHEQLYADDTVLFVMGLRMYDVGLIVIAAVTYLIIAIPFIQRKQQEHEFKKREKQGDNYDSKYSYLIEGIESLDDIKGTAREFTIKWGFVRFMIVAYILFTFFHLTSYVKMDVDHIQYKNSIFSEKVYTFEDIEHIKIEGSIRGGYRSGTSLSFVYRLDMNDGVQIPIMKNILRTHHKELIFLNEIFKDMGIERSGYISDRFKEEIQREDYFNEDLRIWFGIE